MTRSQYIIAHAHEMGMLAVQDCVRRAGQFADALGLRDDPREVTAALWAASQALKERQRSDAEDFSQFADDESGPALTIAGQKT